MKKGTQDKKIKKILIIAGIAAGILLTAYIGISVSGLSSTELVYQDIPQIKS